MRIPSGVTDQVIYFVAVDATDLKTRETGLSSFTVYRSRDGGAATAYTTPTVTEVSSANMPGVYKLLLDEDMTIASGNDSEEVCLHITQASMAPVTRVFELYRPKITAGETVTAASGSANAAVQSIASNAITAASIASGAFTAAKFAAGALDAVWSTTTRLLTAGTNIVLAKGTGITGFNDLSAAQVNAEVDTALADYDGPTNAEMVARTLTAASYATATALQTVDDNVDAILVDTAEIGAAGAGLTAVPWNVSWDAEVQSEVTDALNAYDPPTKAELDSAVSPLATAANLATVDTVVDAIKVTTDKLDTALEIDGAVYRYTTNALEQAPTGGSAPSAADIRAEIDANSTQLAAIKAKTDSLTFTTAWQVDANIQYVNDVEVTGNGQTGTEWGPA
jgi:hypothetical protein